jgi:hypothetical protein
LGGDGGVTRALMTHHSSLSSTNSTSMFFNIKQTHLLKQDYHKQLYIKAQTEGYFSIFKLTEAG